MIPPVDTTLENRLPIRKTRIVEDIPMGEYDVPEIIKMSGIQNAEVRPIRDIYVVEGKRGDTPVVLQLYPSGTA